ncbi:unnamed protein product [Cylicostephanus goldi]|uniref:Uncharacterized protein n=1 Tax=Cylicostephanus goldi TaxID=71465 RepID=A0A3P6S020_CYLGO|nr:unnamed protein product [Cylicostephanus goldi]
MAPHEFDIKQQLTKAVILLKQRNKLLIVADSDPDVWEFYDHHKKGETRQAFAPILTAPLREKKKEGQKKNLAQTQIWKSKFRPYKPHQQPFRVGEATWTPASPYFQPYSRSPPFALHAQRSEFTGPFGSHLPEQSTSPRLMCCDCVDKT